MLAIINKELRSYFASATGYIFMSFFLLISGIFFSITNLLGQNPLYNNVLSSITFIFLFVVPMLTMRLISEETRQKTDQLLLTSPLKVSDIVLGKYFAALLLFLLTLLITVLYPIILSFYGNVAVGEVLGGYIGFFLLGAAFISVGLFISSLTENQVISAVVTVITLLVLWIMDGIIMGLPTDRKSSIVVVGILVIAIAALLYYSTKNIYISAGAIIIGAIAMVLLYVSNPAIYDGIILKLFQWFSLMERYQSFSFGIFDISSVVYFITFSFAFIFLTIQTIEKRRWS
ncbi:MAG TPA: ABC transporter permease [Defluviitaleaceae bacterium]|jgi:ABC-2 type transport system permease protein|nr:ABC transporter permease [Candidatus Epulonipiscium sp.]HOA80039.1 ABC transporter permease [Defluviitaleaceae bacterium]